MFIAVAAVSTWLKESFNKTGVPLLIFYYNVPVTQYVNQNYWAASEL